MSRYLCNECDNEWSDGEDGFCAGCRDVVEERQLRRAIDAMTESEYREFMDARCPIDLSIKRVA